MSIGHVTKGIHPKIKIFVELAPVEVEIQTSPVIDVEVSLTTQFEIEVDIKV